MVNDYSLGPAVNNRIGSSAFPNFSEVSSVTRLTAESEVLASSLPAATSAASGAAEKKAPNLPDATWQTAQPAQHVAGRLEVHKFRCMPRQDPALRSGRSDRENQSCSTSSTRA